MPPAVVHSTTPNQVGFPQDNLRNEPDDSRMRGAVRIPLISGMPRAGSLCYEGDATGWQPALRE
jgi:hypothetical protein